jgi:hypothetical protein
VNKQKKWLVGLVVVLALVVVRWVDCKLMWELGRMEYRAIPQLPWIEAGCNEGRTVFLGFSTRNRALEVLRKERAATDKDVVVVSYYNLLVPVAYLCDNRLLEKDFKTLLPYSPGYPEANSVTEFYHLKCDLLVSNRRHSWDVQVARVLGSMFDEEWVRAREIEAERAAAKASGQNFFGIGFTTSYSSKILKRIFIFYFYFPLIAIFLLGIFYSKKIFLALYYFVIAPFFFDPFLIMFGGGTFWMYFLDYSVFKELGIITIFLTGLLILFYFIIKGIRQGHKQLKLEPLAFTEKAVIWFFFLFLVAIRF